MSNRHRWPLWVLGALITLYIAYFSGYVLTATDRCQFGGSDLAIYDQTVWNTIHGRWFRSTYEPGWDILLADHVEPILLPISLLYLLWDSPKTLLVLQTVALALGALPVYWLARDALQAAFRQGPAPDQEAPGSTGSRAGSLWIPLSALAFALAYLFYPPLQSANLFEFHPSTLAAPLLLYALLFMRQRRVIPFFLFILLAMSTKETLPLTTAALGLYILLVRREWLVGIATIAASALWFVVAVYGIIPHFNPGGQSHYFSFSYYSWLGGEGSILARLLTHPGLILERLVAHTGPAYLAGILGPLAYLCLLGLPMLLPAIPTLALNALSDNMWQHYLGSYFHYAAPLVPFVIVAAIDGASFLSRQVGRLAGQAGAARFRPAAARRLVAVLLSGLILVTSVIGQWRHGYLPFSRGFYLVAKSEGCAAIRDIARQVAPESSVSTVWYPAPFLSHREDLYLFPQQLDADYLIADAGYRDWPFPPRDRYDMVQGLLQDRQAGVRDGRDGYLFLERGLDQPTIPDRFYDFARAENPSPRFQTAVDFGDELRLLGFDLVWERPFLTRAYLVLYWQALQPVHRDLRIFFFQTDPAGQVLPATELEFVAPVWYPPSRWSTSEVIRTETFHWYLAEPEQFGVAIGVVEGPGLWELDSRLRPVIRSAPWDLRLIHGETLLWLGTLDVADQAATLQRPQAPSSQSPD